MSSGRKPDPGTTPERERLSKTLTIACAQCSQRIVDKSESIECAICRNIFHFQCANQGALTEELLRSLKITGTAYICRKDQIMVRGKEKFIARSVVEAFNTEREKHAQTNLEIPRSQKKIGGRN